MQVDKRRPHEVALANEEMIKYLKANMPFLDIEIEKLQTEYDSLIAGVEPGQETPELKEKLKVLETTRQLKSNYDNEIIVLQAQNIWMKAQQAWQKSKRKSNEEKAEEKEEAKVKEEAKEETKEDVAV